MLKVSVQHMYPCAGCSFVGLDYNTVPSLTVWRVWWIPVSLFCSPHHSGGGEKARLRQIEKGGLFVRKRIDLLLDPG